jgi:hypothetical protein
MMTGNHDKMDAWLAEKQDGRKETIICQETTEDNPEKLKACQETTACREVE